MPPHARMSLTQQLLLRALMAWFWRQPYRQKLVRWGTGLVDRSRCRTSSAQDFGDVLDDLRAAGYAFRREWFHAHKRVQVPAGRRDRHAGAWTLEVRHGDRALARAGRGAAAAAAPPATSIRRSSASR